MTTQRLEHVTSGYRQRLAMGEKCIPASTFKHGKALPPSGGDTLESLCSHYIFQFLYLLQYPLISISLLRFYEGRSMPINLISNIFQRPQRVPQLSTIPQKEMQSEDICQSKHMGLAPHSQIASWCEMGSCTFRAGATDGARCAVAWNCGSIF